MARSSLAGQLRFVDFCKGFPGGGFLFANAKKGNVTAQIFWLKTQAGWKEPAVDHNHRGAIGSYDLTKVSDDDLDRIEAILAAGAGGSNPDGADTPAG